MPQWVSGQLTNIYNMHDSTMVKQALLQVILATRDATSLPWPTVRNAWATSMHELEEGSLKWSDTTQWSLNCLSTSQMAMNNIQAPNATSRHCKYEGSYTHESNHGNYIHACSYWSKQVRQFSHPEARCSFKSRVTGRTQGNNTN